MADLICPNCGMPNPEEQNVCSFCRQPLRPPVSNEAIHPGEQPTKKTTSELESVLPDWLREAREKARRGAEEQAAEEAQAAADSKSKEPAVPDWLAGLEAAAHAEESEEAPEWLGGAAKAKPPAAPPPQNAEELLRQQEIQWEEQPPADEMGGLAQPVPESEGMGALPPWLQGDEEKTAGDKDEFASFLKEKAAAPQEEQPSPFASVDKSAPEEKPAPPSTGELAQWLDNLTSQTAAPQEPPPQPAPAEAAPPLPTERPFPLSTGELTRWLDNLSSQEAEPAKETPPPAASEPLPGWLSKLPAEETQPPASEPSAPDWLSSIPAAETQPEVPASGAELPDWLKSAEASAPPEAGESTQPDWLSTLHAAEEKPSPAPVPESSAPSNVPAFLPAEEAARADEAFSIEMPDWLSSIGPSDDKGAPETPQSPAPSDAIAPAELPSWVQAMRPVETVLGNVDAAFSAPEGPLEEQGPLAGLRGVLPAGQSLAGKPRTHSMRLQATESQQTSASLLERMLVSETQASPLAGTPLPASQRTLRWTLAAVLFAFITFILLLRGTQIIALPTALPAESENLVPVLESLPENAPVLVAFDYEPALAGEVEAAAAPFLDRLVGLRRPRLTLISTSPVGPALAERFMTVTLKRLNYLSEQDYINLGYLPGGPMGVLAFAENPQAARPFDIQGVSAWDKPAVQNVRRFSDYAAIVLITDQAETARAWVEQTAAQRGGRPLLVISSAQAAPMIEPYLLSGQVNGMVSGLQGGAAFDSLTEYNGKIRSYWDAYNLGILVVCLLIVVGGLWNLILGIRARRPTRVEV